VFEGDLGDARTRITVVAKSGSVKLETE